MQSTPQEQRDAATSLETLGRLMSDESPHVRVAAATALGEAGDLKVLPALARALSDTDPSVRTAAVSSLARIGGLSARGLLRRALADPDDGVRRRANEAFFGAAR